MEKSCPGKEGHPKVDPFARLGGWLYHQKRVTRLGGSPFQPSQLFVSHVNGSPGFVKKCRKSWLAQGSSGRQVTLLPGTTFRHINGALGELRESQPRSQGLSFSSPQEKKRPWEQDHVNLAQKGQLHAPAIFKNLTCPNSSSFKSFLLCWTVALIHTFCRR